MIKVTMPLGVTLAVIVSPTPVLALPIEFVTPPPMALVMDPCSVGTVVPTLMDAGMLSVAIIDGVEMTFALLCVSINDTMPERARLLPTSMDAVNAAPPPLKAESNEAAVLVIAVPVPEDEVPVEVDPADPEEVEVEVEVDDVDEDPPMGGAVPESVCSWAVTSLENAWVKSTE